MKKNFMTRVLAVALSAAMALSMATATNLTVAEAASKPAMKTSSFKVRIGNKAKNYYASAATQKAYKIVKAKAGNTDKATAKVVKSGKAVAITAGTKTGKTNITLTFKNKKTAAKKTLKFSGKVLEAKVVAATIKEVKQTKGTELVVTLSKEVESVKAADFAVTRDDDNLKAAVSSATLDEKDKTKVTVVTYLSMVDGKTYTVDFTSAEEKKSSAKFTATDGVVASTAVTPVQITANTATTIYYQTIDANGVIIDEKSLGKADNSKITYTYTVTKGNGTLDANGKATLVNVGDTMEISVTYHTFKWANGVEEGAATGKTTVTAVPSTAAVDKFNYTIALKAPVNWSKEKQNTRVCVDDTMYNLYARILDNNGMDITDTCGYTVESSDTSTLIVTTADIKDAAGGTGINVRAVKAGAAYILVKDENGRTVTTFPVETGAKRVLSTVMMDKSSLTLATKAGVNAANDEDLGLNAGYIKVMAFDQYNDLMVNPVISNIEITTGSKNYGANNTSVLPAALDAVNGPTTGGVYAYTGILVRNDSGTETPAELATGTDYYTFNTTVGEKTLKSRFQVNWTRQTGSAVLEVAFTADGNWQDNPTVSTWDSTTRGVDALAVSSVDTTVGYTTAAADKDQVVYAHIISKKNGTVNSGAALASGASIKSIQVTGPNGVVAQTGAGLKLVTSAAIDEAALQQMLGQAGTNLYLPIKVVDKSDITTTGVVKNLKAGNYSVHITLKDDTKVGSATFTIADSQASAYAKVLETSATGTTINDFLDDPDNVQFFFDEYNYTIKGVRDLDSKVTVNTAKDIVLSNNGKTMYVRKATVTFYLVGDTTKNVQIEVPINQAFTTTNAGGWTI